MKKAIVHCSVRQMEREIKNFTSALDHIKALLDGHTDEYFTLADYIDDLTTARTYFNRAYRYLLAEIKN